MKCLMQSIGIPDGALILDTTNHALHIYKIIAI